MVKLDEKVRSDICELCFKCLFLRTLQRKIDTKLQTIQFSCSLVIQIHYYDWKSYDFTQPFQAYAKTVLLVYRDRPRFAVHSCWHISVTLRIFVVDSVP